MSALLIMFWWLLVGHAIADFLVQTDFIAKMKNRHNDVIPVSPGRSGIWVHVLTAHALTHGAAVALITGSVALGVAETICHWLIDFGKSENLYGIHVDQALHVWCKVMWIALLVFM